MLVQLNSGIPLFDILTNISNSNYGELSLEFKKAVKDTGLSSEAQAFLSALEWARENAVDEKGGVRSTKNQHSKPYVV